MSKHNLNSLALVAVLAFAIFVVAFALLMFVGDYRFLGSFFLAFIIALLAAIVLFLGLGRPAEPIAQPAMRQAQPASSGAVAGAVSSGATAAATDDGAAARKAAEEAEAERGAEHDRREAERARVEEEARAAKVAEDEAKRAAAEAEAERERMRKAKEEAEAAQKARDDAAAEEAARNKAADNAAAARSAEELAARKAAEEKEAARLAAEEARAAREAQASVASLAGAPVAPAAAAPVAANSGAGEDYDGDGVREGVNEGTRPEGLDAPRDGKADDLKQIKGVGPKLEKLCNTLGFWHFDQVAAWTADEVAWVDANLTGFKGRVSRDEWVKQAGILAGGGETEFSKRVEDGDVY